MTGSNNSFGLERQNGLWINARPSRRSVLLGAGGLAVAGALAGCAGKASTGASTSATGSPKRGGDFRLGATGTGAKEAFNAHLYSGTADTARGFTAFETLLSYDDQYRLTNEGLAESVEADSPTQYTIKLRKGIEFQNGKTLSADDVIYSLQRIGDKSLGLNGYTSTLPWDLAGLKKVDESTVILPLKTPDSTTKDKLASYFMAIVPQGYDGFKGDPATQIGTGAYKLKSFTPGQESVSERHPNYWRDTYFDTVTIVSFADTTAQVNALLGGQIHAMTDLPATQVAAVQARGSKVLKSQTGWFHTMSMAIDKPPFDDPRVRQAFKLIIDRKRMLDQVGSGYGEIGNDLFGIYDPAYDKALPQREQDIDQAKSLLKAAGHEGLTMDLPATPSEPALMAMSQVFAEQAKAAGVTINVKSLPSETYWGSDYLKYTFSTDWFGPKPYLLQVQQNMLPTSPYNGTHWPPKSGSGSNYESLYQQALAATDDAKRTELIHEMQKLEYDLGGMIIPFFPSKIDGHAANLQGLSEAKTIFGLNNFGHGYRTIWFG